jgi:hypothetical protein
MSCAQYKTGDSKGVAGFIFATQFSFPWVKETAAILYAIFGRIHECLMGPLHNRRVYNPLSNSFRKK